ncbi:hypothetical protein [Lentibacillus cibarius]|uniref:Uncharacterized protein n=1 Tax=Lentibacillus cibarius TaxID=2583219 RepID=A0A5S3QI66_9BACI|nr:hypothetical protein [Lentibacillus cibarius]TMN20891.1 hypothetical protein FFL34_01260 [Lentibacillus cibarius]
MEKNEMEMEENNKTSGWKSKLNTAFLVAFVLGCIFGWIGIIRYIMKVIHTDESVVYFSLPMGGAMTVIFFSMGLGILTVIFLILVKNLLFKKYHFAEFKEYGSGVLYGFIALVIVSSPFMFFAADNYISVTKEGVGYSRYWTVGDGKYSWDKGVKKITLDYSYFDKGDTSDNFSGMYTFHFSDGKHVEIWENSLDGNFDSIERIDEIALKHNMAYEVIAAPSNEQIEKWIPQEHQDFVKELFSK